MKILDSTQLMTATNFVRGYQTNWDPDLGRYRQPFAMTVRSGGAFSS